MDLRDIARVNPPTRILLGPGPGMPHPRVMSALGAPTLGHLDPQLIRIFEAEQQMLRHVFQTSNDWTFALSGTGTAAMEAALANLVEDGDPVLACVNGYFGGRLADMAARLGAGVDRIERPLGEIFTIEEIAAALKKRHYKLTTIVHAETSTGAEQKHIQEIAAAAHAAGSLLVLDVVTSLAGIPVQVDAWDIDAAYSASQKNSGGAVRPGSHNVWPTSASGGRVRASHRSHHSIWIWCNTGTTGTDSMRIITRHPQHCTSLSTRACE